MNIQNCENLTGNFVHYICTECKDLLKNGISRTTSVELEIAYNISLRNAWIFRKIEYPELRIVNRKLCTLYVRSVWISRKIEYPEMRTFNGKLCTLYTYEMSGYA